MIARYCGDPPAVTMMSPMRLKSLHISLVGLGVMAAGVYGLMAPASAQAPQGPVSTTVVRPGPYGAPTQLQAVIDTPGRTAVVEEYRVGETQVPGAVADAEEAPFAPPTRVRFTAAVAFERGGEERRVKGLKIVIERPGQNGQADDVVCYVDRAEMAPLAKALMQLAETATRRDGGRDAGRGGGGRDARWRDRDRDRPAVRSASYAAADFAVTVRSESGRPTIEVRNPNRPDSQVLLGDGAIGALDQWADWIGAAHVLLERK